MSCRVGGTLLRAVMDNQWSSVANHEELDERPLDFVREGINIYLKKKRQRIEWNFFFKTACNTNPAKTIVQKVTKQQSLGLMQ